jgi:crotonobetainyl-CoA:carnitine CoA-transferase CaiB-like acyl-CoA transferase
VSTRTVADCLAQLDAIEVPSAKVQGIDEVVADPQVLARGMLIEQEHPVLGKVKLPNLPFHFSGCDTTITTPAPLMGQHNRSIAGDLGYSAAEIDQMFADGVLYAESAVK